MRVLTTTVLVADGETQVRRRLLRYYRYRPYDAHSGWVRLTYLF